MPPTDDGMATGDPASLAREFWLNIGAGHRQVAEDVARMIEPPLVLAFSFKEVEVEDQGEMTPGTLRSMVTPKTPSQVSTAWNSPKSVYLVQVNEEETFMASLQLQGTTEDFQACILPKMGIGVLPKSVQNIPTVQRGLPTDPG